MKALKQTGLYFVSLFFLVLFGFPFIMTLFMSFKSQQEYMRGNRWGFPQDIFLGNFQRVLAANFTVYFKNSIIVAFTAVAFIIVIASMAGYAFSKLRFKWNKPLFLLFLVGMMIPVHTTLIPIYQLTRSLGLSDRLPGLIGPYISFGLPLGIYILTSFFREVPASIQESALMDGASHLRIHWSIMMPLSTPAISTVGIYCFLTCWNEFIYSLTLISSNSRKTLPLGIRQFYGAETVNIPSVLTAILVGSLPVMLFYFFAQERVINGLSAGAVKG